MPRSPSKPGDTARRRVGIAAVIAVLGVVVVALQWWEPSSSSTVVRIGLVGTPDVLDIPYFIASDRDFYADQGIEVEYVPLQGDAMAVHALLAGEVDVAAAGHLSVIRAVAQGIPVRAFVSVQDSHDYVLATPDSIRNVSDLRGRAVGVFAPADITQIVTQLFLEDNGLEKDDVEWLAVGGGTERYLALLAGRVAAAPLHADYGHRIAAEDGFHVLASIAAEQPLPMTVVIATDAYLSDRPDVAERLTRALIGASRLAVADKRVFLEVAGTHLQLTPDELGPVYDFLRDQSVWAADGGLSTRSLQNAVQALLSAGEIGEPIPVSKIATLDFIDAVLADTH